MSEFEKQIHNMFDHIWDCDINHQIFGDTIGDLMKAVIQCYENLQSTEPEWIPYTPDTMPQNEEEVLTTYIVNGNYKNCLVETATWFDVGYWSSPWDEFRAPGTKKEVIAWMHLPQPYQSKVNEK